MGSKVPILLALLAPLAIPALRGQTVCGPTPVYSICEIKFELSAEEAAAHPDPYRTVQIESEFRSPRHKKTYRLAAFWTGGKQFTIRFAPTEAGDWQFRLIGNLARLNGKEDHFSSPESNARGFVAAANVHHFAYTAANQPHLWMGDALEGVATLGKERFEQLVNARAAQKFNHLRVRLLENEGGLKAPGQLDPQYFAAVDERLLYLNSKGLTADLVLAGGDNQLTRLLPEREQRERFVRYLAARYAALDITWQGIDSFETYEDGRELLKEIYGYLKTFDPYDHIRSTGAQITSASLIDDGWMNYIAYRTSDDQVPAVEHQLYSAPAVDDFGGATADEFRRNLWNATMAGAYPAAKVPNEEAAKQMAVWYVLFAGTRHWDLEPFFDTTNGRGLALEDVEYVIYLDKPGPVDVQIEKEKWDVEWINPVNGESQKLKDFKGDRFTGEPPDRLHDWVLHISREGHKASMLRSYKFEARDVVLQEVESNPAKLPFDIAEPAGDTLSLSKPATYLAKLKKETPAARKMMYVWTAEVTADGKSYRVVGTGSQGTLAIPKDLARRYPAALHLRLTGMNGLGKVYMTDRNYTLNP